MRFSTIAISVVVLVAGASAQPPGPYGRMNGGARFLGAEAGMPGRVVKNAPYSADVVTDTTQTLPDGNTIHRTNTARVYRDSEGRSRTEQTLGGLNGLAAGASQQQVVYIHDPVAGANYALNPQNRTATKSAWMRGPRPGATAGAQSSSQGQGATTDAANPRRAFRNSQNAKVETLGSQMMNGLTVTGKRVTTTIPAGQIGNAQPIQMVVETWYSADLQTVVLSKRTDPRFGTTVTQMANVSRAEPASTLFQVPADFKVTDRSAMRGPGPGSAQQ